MCACIKADDDDYEMLVTLLSHGADPSVQKASSGMCPLHWICYHGAIDLVKLMLTGEADSSKDLGAASGLRINQAAHASAIARSAWARNDHGQMPLDVVGERLTDKLETEAFDDQGDRMMRRQMVEEGVRVPTRDELEGIINALLAPRVVPLQ